MRLRSLLLAPLLALAVPLVYCGGEVVTIGSAKLGADELEGDGFTGPRITKASKIDILLAVDDSPAMESKQDLLARSLRALIDRVGPSRDIHLGVVRSSLGGFGGDVCGNGPSVNTRALLATSAATGPSGVLSTAASPDVDTFIANAEGLVRATGGAGCGFEAQLESVYQFLAAPEPGVRILLDGSMRASYGNVVVDGGVGSFDGRPSTRDIDVLRQRAAFLRPDSLLVVLMLTDEDDSSVDPFAIDGQGWAFTNKTFPGSLIVRDGGEADGTTAARATTKCATDPGHPDCTSCGFKAQCNAADPTCQRIKQDPNCTKSGLEGKSGPAYDGYYGPSEDPLNVRFHRMKERFGVDPQYPLARYVRAFTAARVPSRSQEHPLGPGNTTDGGVGKFEPYDVDARGCLNPIFATNLPQDETSELCQLTPGVRSPELVMFGLLGGAPRELADTDTPNWVALVGADPDRYDYTGIDPHMVPSVVPRAGLPAPTDPASDPVHGREWDTRGGDLQFACTFDLPEPRTCVDGDASCDCKGAASSQSPPICAANQTDQIRGKAYPTPRELRVAKALGSQAVIGSVCASTPETAYKPFMERLAARMASHLDP